MSLSAAAVNARLARRRSVAAAAVAALTAGAAAAQTSAPATKPSSPAAKPATTTAKPAPAVKAAPPVKAAPKAAAPAPKLPANVFARVGGQDLTGADIQAFLVKLGGYPLVQQRVQIALAEQQAKKYGVTVTPAELDKAVQDAKDTLVKNQMMQSQQPMTFSEIAARQGINEGLIREQARFQLLLKKCFTKVAETQIPPINDRIKVSHLLISTQPKQPPTDPSKPETEEETKKRDADALAKANQLLADIKAGKISWTDAIKQNSDDPSKTQNNGSMGWVGADTGFVPEFKEAMLKIEKVGDIAGPVKSQFGYHLIRLDAKGATATAEEKAAYKKDLVEQQLQNPQAIQMWFYGVTRSANVVYNPAAKFSGAPAAAPAVKVTAAAAPAKKK